MRLRLRRVSSPIVALCVIATVTVACVLIGSFLSAEEQGGLCSSLWSSAGSGENHEVVRLVLDKGVDPNCDQGKPLKDARTRDHTDTVQLLKLFGAKEHP